MAPLPATVAIGGEVGCLLPIAKKPGDDARWRADLAAVLRDLEIGPDTETHLTVEAKAPWSAAVSILGGYADAGLRQPEIALALMETDEGPPACDAPIRSGKGLRNARGTWYGSTLDPVDAEAPPASPE